MIGSSIFPASLTFVWNTMTITASLVYISLTYWVSPLPYNKLFLKGFIFEEHNFYENKSLKFKSIITIDSGSTSQLTLAVTWPWGNSDKSSALLATLRYPVSSPTLMQQSESLYKQNNLSSLSTSMYACCYTHNAN